MDRLKIENLSFHNIGPVSLSIASSECIGITGPSGSGKTLFLRAIADMEPYSGRIFLDDIESVSFSGPEWRKKVGLLPAESAWWHDTVGEHFQQKTEQGWDGSWFETLGFDPDVETWSINRLSSGERQRLALLRLLSNRPKALLLDEPTANLDPENTDRVEKLLENYRIENEPAVIWVSHDVRQLGRVADRRFLLREGLEEINHKSQSADRKLLQTVDSGELP
ncbi:ATP-binding cassette domain-containing protein [Desulfococcaceae bacterium HSG8]|nr:ATP-binding cassette domain-containing protein [Desulfococcaceae bacterium HSG8]